MSDQDLEAKLAQILDAELTQAQRIIQGNDAWAEARGLTAGNGDGATIGTAPVVVGFLTSEVPETQARIEAVWAETQELMAIVAQEKLDAQEPTPTR